MSIYCTLPRGGGSYYLNSVSSSASSSTNNRGANNHLSIKTMFNQQYHHPQQQQQHHQQQHPQQQQFTSNEDYLQSINSHNQQTLQLTDNQTSQHQPQYQQQQQHQQPQQQQQPFDPNSLSLKFNRSEIALSSRLPSPSSNPVNVISVGGIKNQQQQQQVETQRVYYGLDSFDDLKAIRRNSITSLYEDPTTPNFYGDEDSAYDSTSNESLRLTAKEIGKRGNSKKYFTLPTKLGRRMRKQSCPDIAVVDSLTPSPVFSETSSPLGLPNFSSIPTPILPEPILPNQPDYQHQHSHSHSHPHPHPHPHQHQHEQQQNCNPATTNNGGVCHCCCLLGCHSGQQQQQQQQIMPTASSNQQPTLETLWEEPYSGHEAQSVRLTEEAIYAAMKELNISLPAQKSPVNSQTSNNSQGWLKGQFLKAFRKPKNRLKLGNSAGDLTYGSTDKNSRCERPNSIALTGNTNTVSSLSSSSSTTTISLNSVPLPPPPPLTLPLPPPTSVASSSPSPSSFYADQNDGFVRELQRQLAEKDQLLQEVCMESINHLNQIENLKELINQMRDEIQSLKTENDKLQKCLNMESVKESEFKSTFDKIRVNK